MPIEEIIKFLRQSVMVQDPDVAVVDEDFLLMEEADFIPLLTISLAKVDPNDDILNLSSNNLYPLILVAKKELFHRLAMKSARSYSLTSATGVQLKRAEVFDHYYKLIEEVEKEYKTYLSTGVQVTQGNVLLDTRYFSARNYSFAKKPTISLAIDTIHSNNVEVSWRLTRINKFAKYYLYISKHPIVDKYKNNEISPSAKLEGTLTNVHNNCARVIELEPNTQYYVAIVVEERNGLQGYSELKFTTLE